MVEKNKQLEVEIRAREKKIEVLAREFAKKYGLEFVGTSREYPSGSSRPKDPRYASLVPPKSVIKLGFEVAPAGVAGWRVQQRLAKGVVLYGKNSTGWNVWVEEKDLGDITKIFKPEVLPPEEERNRQQSDGTLLNFGGHYRVMGRSNNSDYFVVTPDGALREPDEERGRGYREKYKGSEGDKRWNLVALEELAISWLGGNDFVANKLPTSGVTPEQLRTAKRLQEEIAERFEGVTGWDLAGETKTPAEESVKPVAEGGERASAEQIKFLLDKFKK